MFNKVSTANRNELITRKDVRSVFAGSTTGAEVSTKTAEPSNKTAEPSNDSLTTNPATAVPVENIIGSRLIVGSDVKLKGAEILDCDTLVVEGRVEATMDSRVIRIADKGSFVGKVSIDIAEIYGTFEGELTARSQLIIHATGRVSGKIRYGKLVIDEGGELCGDINSISAGNVPSARPRTEIPAPLPTIVD